MNRLKLIIAALFFSTGIVPAQEIKPMSDFNGDTTDYISYNYELRKDIYVGKPLDNFISDYNLNLGLVEPNLWNSELYGINIFYTNKEEILSRKKTGLFYIFYISFERPYIYFSSLHAEWESC